MAFPLPRGITPPEIAFICEMELVTVIPRQRLERLELLGGPTEPLIPPRRSLLPLWLALLLKRQRRANIVPPSWLHPDSLSLILELETNRDTLEDSFSPPPLLVSNPVRGSSGGGGGRTSRRPEEQQPQQQYTLDGEKYIPSPPFLLHHNADDASGAENTSLRALPYHWVELATMLLDVASDDLVEPDRVRRLLRDLREVRMAKTRKQFEGLDVTAVGGGEGLPLTGMGAMEIGEARAFMSGVAETLRQIGAPKEEAEREKEAEEAANRQYEENDYNDVEMEY
ncbi:hypothetical protein AJ80_04668 [Polytolypa hystricis UAMH7299]|uniref:DNA replication complex GINS protein PSF2 n=1 Tax=Polytolypa hystricis (strain UAMH7299) TaxID=1447883 RepID=A0A2B7Y9B9_POLH7|nr:hypothetical protein AJ80_04668 [Polytolypa hystricis UAMH7299]